jgi:flagellar hook protein FlgE
MGTGRPITVRQFTQGAIQTSSGRLDAAIRGDGFFLVKDGAGQILYTRAGNFHVDAEGHLLSATGERVQGWTAVKGVLDPGSSATGDLMLPSGGILPPQATTRISLDVNLDAGGEVGAASGTFSTPVQVTDSLGASHMITMTFTKTGSNTWDYAASIPGGEISGGTAGTPFAIPGASGTLTFDSRGNLADPPPPPPDTNGVVPIAVTGLTNGAADLNINWALYKADLTPRLTQFAETSAATDITQDGAPAAQLTEVQLGDGGKLMAHFSNGQDELIGQLALATVRNPESLVSVGNNNLQASAETAKPVVGPAATGSRGQIVGGSLESSTADVAREFTTLIVMQRSYQANARVITTTDQLIQDTLSLKQV